MEENRDDLTPMMEQYYELCNEYDDSVVLFQVGDFYETFCEAAEETARVLELTLTQREDNSGEYPMAGIPIDSADSYIEGLLDEGYRVAVADQVQDPDETTGVVRRAVTRVVTPGTVVEDELLEDDDNNYIVSLWDDALGFMDVSTGEFLVTSSESDEILRDEVERFEPSEAVVGRDDDSDFFSEHGYGGMVTRHDGFGRDEAEEIVESYFGDPGILLDGDDEVRAAGGLLSYAEYTQGDDEELDYVNRLRRYDPHDYMVLDPVALRSLEIFESRRSGRTLVDVLDQTACAIGSRKLKNWLRQPLVDVEEIRARHDAVEEWTRLTLPREEVRDLLRDVYDIERLITRVSRGRANARDLLSLKQTLDVVPRVKNAMEGVESERLRELHDALDEMEMEEVRGLIGRAIDEDPPIEITEGGIIKEGFDDELDDLRRTEREGKEWIAELEEKERERTGIDSLKVGFNKVHGYYIEVTNPNLEKVPDDYTRRQTLKNSERFYTPDLKEREDEILGAGEKADKLEYELFKEVRSEVAEESERVQRLADVLAEIDVLTTLGGVAVRNSYSRPEVNTGDSIEIEGGRHPVVETTQDSFVPNDAEIDGGGFGVITGPNMSGKSTYMRQVALTAVMAQTGSFVPADSAKIGVIDRIFTRVGASDDIAGGRSTFMVEMVELSNILHGATDDSLVLLDEVGRGTSTADGLSIARAVTRFIHDEIGAKTMFATHYHELTEIANELNDVFNLHVAAKEKGDEVVFLHEVAEGAASESYGIEVAELAGVPQKVVDDAREFLRQKEDDAGKDREEDEAAVSETQVGVPLEPDRGRDNGETKRDERQHRDRDGGGDETGTESESEEGRTHKSDDDPDTDEIIEEIRETDVANTTPMEALEKLDSLKKKL
ncbi:DNA mismatch repair protein MutS [Halorutilales archaeon Cl-col2-1]